MNMKSNQNLNPTLDSRRSTEIGSAPRPSAQCMNSSLRVPASPQNWAYLRTLREAELAAWEAAIRTTPAAAPLSLVQSVAKASHVEPAERLAYGLVAGVAAAAVAYGLLNSIQFTTHLTAFAEFVRQIVA